MCGTWDSVNSDLTLSLLNQNNEIVSTAHFEICLTAYEILYPKGISSLRSRHLSVKVKYLPIGKYYGAKSPQATLNYIKPLFESIQIICKNNDIYIKQLSNTDFKNSYKAVVRYPPCLSSRMARKLKPENRRK